MGHQGAAEGDPLDLPVTPRFTEGWQSGPPDEAQPEKQASDLRTTLRDSMIHELSIRTFTKGRGQRGRLAILRYQAD